tara:strand:+ start:2493 stop:3206 length:714 start_codon:yes stop_codon:yes gene_type:complete
MNRYKILVANDRDDLASKTTLIIVEHINNVLSQKDRVQIALSGGSTPSAVYKLLSREDIDWPQIDVFLGDERWVDSNDKASNSLMIKETLLSNFPGSQACFHTVPTTTLPNPQASALAFSELINRKCIGEPPVFDIMLLGLGEDGHTASLFPSTPSLHVFDKWTTISSGKGQERITLTAPVLSAASKIIFLVSGDSKQVALKRLLDPLENSDRTPAKLVQSVNEILVLADQSAAGLI